MKYKIALFTITVMVVFTTYIGSSSAHVVVTPATAVPGSYTTFTIGVPNEKQVAVTGLRLAIPAGVTSVMPTVQSGWTITTKQNNDSVSEISWQGSTIPAGQRDSFSFSAKVTAVRGDLAWKAYQTYADGSVMSWDKPPSTNETDDDESTSGPYSVTSAQAAITDAETTPDRSFDWLALPISLIAVILALIALFRRR